MSPFIAFIVAAFLAGIGIGGIGVHQVDSASIKRYELALQVQKTEAQGLFDATQAHIAKVENDAVIANQQLDQSHESAIKSINTLHDAFASSRLRDPGRRQGGTCPVSTGTNTGKSEAKTDSAELSAELTGFLIDQTYQADTVAAYADACYRFVENNCGVSQ